MKALNALQDRFTKPSVGARAVQLWENADTADKD